MFGYKNSYFIFYDARIRICICSNKNKHYLISAIKYEDFGKISDWIY